MKTILTKADCETIKQLYYDGWTKRDICSEKRISLYTLNDILAGRRIGEEYARYSNRAESKKMPAGGIYPGMIAAVKETLQVGDFVDVTQKNESVTKRKYCRVTGKYPFLFTVAFGKETTSFPYKDLLIRDSGVRFDRRKACKEGKNC